MTGNSPRPLPEPEMTLEVSPSEVAGWHRLPASERPRLIDCREVEELAICRIEGAEWLPLGDFPAKLQGLADDASRGIVVLCHHGMRSLRAANFLRAHGIGQAFSMSGGIDLWSRTIDPDVPRY